MRRRTIVLAPVLMLLLSGCIFLPNSATDDVLTGDDGDTEITNDVDGEGDNGDSDSSPEDISGEEGSLENPLELGTRVESEGWAFTVLHIGHNADQEVHDNNPFVEDSPEGFGYTLVTVQIENLTDATEQPAAVFLMTYHTDDGEQINVDGTGFDTPHRVRLFDDLEPGQLITGNVPVVAPEGDHGVFSVVFGENGVRAYWAL